jgi:hypothetical protein
MKPTSFQPLDDVAVKTTLLKNKSLNYSTVADVSRQACRQMRTKFLGTQERGG